ncbi:hypothetical protein BKA70DRAFT_1247074 [Coprinopsis sp. MPI-PUGE-AT-0042]|nr:hypothetical protein BKA70DRAFT_1247074 [Coprinopsis sp. MPI-PUGE-AT-0042]
MSETEDGAKRKKASSSRAGTGQAARKVATNGKRPAQKQAKHGDNSEDEVQEVMEVDASADEDGGEEHAPQRTSKKPARGSCSEEQKASGKAPEVVNVEEDEDDMEDGAAELAATLNKANYANAEKERKGSAGKQASARETKLIKENATLKDSVERLKGHLADLKAKFEELMNIRETEAEALLERANTGSSDYSRYLKGELDEAKQLAESQDKQIGNLKAQAKELRVELDAEIDRTSALSKQQAKAAPPSTSKGTAFTTVDNPLHAKTSPTKSAYGMDDYSFNCIYTHYDPADPDQNSTTLNFFLHFRHEPPAGATYKPGMKLAEVIHYSPSGLENEPKEFVKKLAFLAAPFSFDRRQLALLVKTLNELNEDENDEDENQMDAS